MNRTVRRVGDAKRRAASLCSSAPATRVLAWPAAVLLAILPALARADVIRWDTGQMILGTEGITPGPGAQLNQLQLKFAALIELNLANANFAGANLTNAWLNQSTLTDANLAGATVTGASFSGTTSRGFSKEQLYSTASYQAKNLRDIRLHLNDLSGWDFSGQDLTHAWLNQANLTNANLLGAVVTGADLADTTSRGFTKEQFYSTASYQSKTLGGMWLYLNDMSGWDFSGQNLILQRPLPHSSS